jgi:hypothetical protein
MQVFQLVSEPSGLLGGQRHPFQPAQIDLDVEIAVPGTSLCELIRRYQMMENLKHQETR